LLGVVEAAGEVESLIRARVCQLVIAEPVREQEGGVERLLGDLGFPAVTEPARVLFAPDLVELLL
jgi:hypothetical protein